VEVEDELVRRQVQLAVSTPNRRTTGCSTRGIRYVIEATTTLITISNCLLHTIDGDDKRGYIKEK